METEEIKKQKHKGEGDNVAGNKIQNVVNKSLLKQSTEDNSPQLSFFTRVARILTTFLLVFVIRLNIGEDIEQEFNFLDTLGFKVFNDKDLLYYWTELYYLLLSNFLLVLILLSAIIVESIFRIPIIIGIAIIDFFGLWFIENIEEPNFETNPNHSPQQQTIEGIFNVAKVFGLIFGGFYAILYFIFSRLFKHTLSFFHYLFVFIFYGCLRTFILVGLLWGTSHIYASILSKESSQSLWILPIILSSMADQEQC